nr:hypothetical protein Iba_scaffold31646CG0010 [Ipomoea batatas]GMC63717.1 hypothetical protein Iba_scaffold60368CG0010 [Ipomoea batatas]GMC83780.1 hypothetical protein Iba_scaffold63524CG0010 [Ipomoea batatas]GMD17059.1 hypothetical protein Iba_scaffold41215CG0010 [Ipomoea batatas]GME01484.1 hypothetical protein Iba_scaffold57635CG0010 [Ipomoea batatas]
MIEGGVLMVNGGDEVCGVVDRREVDTEHRNEGEGVGSGFGPGQSYPGPGLTNLAHEGLISAGLRNIEVQGPGTNVTHNKNLEQSSSLPEAVEIEQNSSLVLNITGNEPIKVGSSGRSKGRRRRKKRGFRVGNALQILALDYGDEERLDGLEKWIEDLKEKVGHDKELVRAVDEAYEEVLELFEEALEELGLSGDDMDDELVCKAALIFWKKWENIVQAGKELRELQAVEEGQLSSGGVEMEESKEKDCESDVEEGFLESSNAWIDELEDLTGVEWLNGVLVEIKSYMDVVFCKVRRIHLENRDEMARKACVILMEMDKADPSGGCLGPNTKLGRQLRANQEWLGGKLCRWAWRAHGPGYDE